MTDTAALVAELRHLAGLLPDTDGPATVGGRTVDRLALETAARHIESMAPRGALARVTSHHRGRTITP